MITISIKVVSLDPWLPSSCSCLKTVGNPITAMKRINANDTRIVGTTQRTKSTFIATHSSLYDVTNLLLFTFIV